MRTIGFVFYPDDAQVIYFCNRQNRKGYQLLCFIRISYVNRYEFRTIRQLSKGEDGR